MNNMFTISDMIVKSSTVFQITIPLIVILSAVTHMYSELLFFIISDKWIIDRVYIVLTSLVGISQILIMSITLKENESFHNMFATIYFTNLIFVLLLNTCIYIYRRLMNPNFKLICLLILFFKLFFIGFVMLCFYVFVKYNMGFYALELVITSVATMFFAINSLSLYDMDDYVVASVQSVIKDKTPVITNDD